MNYKKDILEHLLDMYERRKDYKKSIEETRAISLDIAKQYTEYVDPYNHTAYKDINLSIDELERCGYISTKKDNRGNRLKVTLVLTSIDEIYKFLKRVPEERKCKSVVEVLSEYHQYSNQLLHSIISDFENDIANSRKLPYNIGFDADKLRNILKAIAAILNLKTETYTRNFSTAIFKDSKIFQNEYESVVQSILFDYTESVIEKKRILEVYNLYDNPTYVLLKGKAIIYSASSVINIQDFPGGISLPESALSGIDRIQVLADSVITVENLTTYHDCKSDDALYVYLGGFHNTSKENLLKMVYRDNSDKRYFHKGDLDVYGFAILSNLRKKTLIEFQPMEMDVDTLMKYYDLGLYKELTEKEKKLIRENAFPEYQEVLNCMLEHNCKVEQESIVANTIE